MRENRSYGSEGGGTETNQSSLPLSSAGKKWIQLLLEVPFFQTTISRRRTHFSFAQSSNNLSHFLIAGSPFPDSLIVPVKRSDEMRRGAQVAWLNRRSKCQTPGMILSVRVSSRLPTYLNNGKEYCMSHGNHDQFRLGFLTAVEDAERGFVGGLLITNRFGRPLEFQCTAPVKPSRTQQILYGPTLKPYVLGELIGRTLLEKVGVKPHIVLVESPDLLELRSASSTPVAYLFPELSSSSSKLPDAQSQQTTQTSPNRLNFGSEFVGYHIAHESDRQEIEKYAKLVPADAELREPFERVREALTETIRLSMSRPA